VTTGKLRENGYVPGFFDFRGRWVTMISSRYYASSYAIVVAGQSSVVQMDTQILREIRNSLTDSINVSR